MGRKKILIKKIENDKKRGFSPSVYLFEQSEPFSFRVVRTITFNKRRSSVIKKAMELSILCDTKVAVVVVDGNQEAAVYSSTDFDQIVQTVTIKRPPRILSNPDYDFLFPNGVDESSEASLNRLRSLLNNTVVPVSPDAARQAMSAAGGSSSSSMLKTDAEDGPLAPGTTSLPKFSPTILQNLQQQFLLHTAMQIGNPNAAQTTQQAIQALQLIQAMLPSGSTGSATSSSSSSSMSTTVAPLDTPQTDPVEPLLHASPLGGEDSPSSTMQAPSFSLPLPTPGISAQLAELHALFQSNTNPQTTPSPTSAIQISDVSSLSPSSNQALSSSGAVAFAIPNAPVSRPAASAQSVAPLPSAGLNFELNKDGSSDFSDVLNNSGTIGKRPSLSVSIPVENQYLPQLLALSQRKANAESSSSSSSSSSGALQGTDGAGAAPIATAAAAAAAGAAAASAAVDQNKPLLTPGDFLMQQTPGWLPAPSPLGAPLMTPGLGTTPSAAPFNFPMFSPK